MSGYRWGDCVAHYDAEVPKFFKQYFSDDDRKCLLIGGAGFDPRTIGIIECLSGVLGERLSTHLIKEERPNPDQELVGMADDNQVRLTGLCKNFVVDVVQIFADDNYVVGGRHAIESISKKNLGEFTDVVIDMSALSMGVSYPIITYVYNAVRDLPDLVNVHLAVLSNPALDTLISSDSNDRASDVRGFSREELFGESKEKARLWLPQLTESKQQVLSMIHAEIRPHDTCPILPFPSEDPKKADRIACSMIPFLENEWNVDQRNYLYADERKPLDIYRTILRIDDERRPVFESFGGSTIILSPMGSKIPAIGALMAALERQFPVVYVEALAYHLDNSKAHAASEIESRMVHIWLFGEAYYRDLNPDTKH